MFPVLQIGSFTLQTPGLILLLSIWVGLSSAEKYARELGMNANQIDNLVFTALISALLVARLAYAIRYLPAFLDNPIGFVSLNPAMLDFEAGLLVGLVSAWVYGQRHRVQFWRTMDALTPLFALIAIGLGLSHIASGDAFGASTHLPWGIPLWGETRHPSQFYETALAILIAALLWPWAKFDFFDDRSVFSTPGMRFLVFTALSAAARIFLETFRGDSSILIGNIRTAQVVAWLILAIAVRFINLRYPKEEGSK
jgi:phosphatidylglycerol---prolipoprotein diacylglyceryl transferase